MFSIIADSIVHRIKSASTFFHSEEDVRLRCEGIFIGELKNIGLIYEPKYEAPVSSGSIDALFNCLCIEYKKPGELDTRFDFHVAEKMKCIPALAKKYNVDESQIACVILDGY